MATKKPHSASFGVFFCSLRAGTGGDMKVLHFLDL